MVRSSLGEQVMVAGEGGNPCGTVVQRPQPGELTLVDVRVVGEQPVPGSQLEQRSPHPALDLDAWGTG